MSKFQCICGKSFNTKNALSGHKASCRIYLGDEKYTNMLIKRSEKSLNIYNKRLSDFIDEKHTCKNCGKIMTSIFGSGVYCSRSCSNARHHANKYNGVCLNCNKPLIKWKQQKFCSIHCMHDYESSKVINEWLETGEFKTKSMPECIRKYLMIEANYSCSQCGWNERNIYSNTVPLEIDHIDGNSLNNHKHNLRVLCPNCHSLTATYKNLNKGKGRKSLGLI